jgi:dTDP-L-rhamnose 4-epimerase
VAPRRSHYDLLNAVGGPGARPYAAAMLILVTGGAGFVGSHVVESLHAAGHDTRVLDTREGADVRDPEAVAAALRGVDHVCHQAGMVGLGVDFLDVVDYASHNDLGTAVLLRGLARHRFRGRLVLASSMVVYGEGRYTCTAHGPVRPLPRRAADLAAGRFEPRCPRCDGELAPEAIREDAALEPRNVYAATKLHQEHLAFAFARETGTAVTALRYHNVYGPRMPRDTPYAGVSAILADALAAGRAPRVFEDGGQLRDFVHVRDVARANARALLAGDDARGAFNICSGRPRSVAEMARALRAAHGPGAPAIEVTGDSRLGDVRHVFASPALAAERLGFTAVESFAAGMAELADEHRLNPASDPAEAGREAARIAS